MIVLGIESSCDETAAAVVRDGREVLSSVIHSQIVSHRPYGGVVPEIASREHVAQFPIVVAEAVSRAKVDWQEIDALAVTHGPGLVSSLLIGLSGARALGQALGKPVWGVNHLEAHIAGMYLDPATPPPAECCPVLVLLVSGGHSCLVEMRAVGEYRRHHYDKRFGDGLKPRDAPSLRRQYQRPDRAQYVGCTKFLACQVGRLVQLGRRGR